MDKPSAFQGTYHTQIDLGRTFEVPRHSLVNDYLTFRLPKYMAWVDTNPVAAPEKADGTPQLDTPEQAVNRVTGELADALNDKPGTDLSTAIDKLHNLIFLKYKVKPEVLRVDLPYNNRQVVAGGYALLCLPTHVDRTGAVEVDRPALAQDLAAHRTLSPLLRSMGRGYLVLEAAETQVLASVGQRVEQALERSMSMIAANAELRRELAPALEIRGQPALEAQATRIANENMKSRLIKDLEDAAAHAPPKPATPPAEPPKHG